MLVNPPGVVGQHVHKIEKPEIPVSTGTSTSLGTFSIGTSKEEDPS